jgi:hypothetical protein
MTLNPLPGNFPNRLNPNRSPKSQDTLLEKPKSRYLKNSYTISSYIVDTFIVDTFPVRRYSSRQRKKLFRFPYG